MKTVLALLATLVLASCTIPESSPRLIDRFAISQGRTYLVDQSPSSFDGVNLLFVPIQDGTFGDCFERVTPGCPPSYSFGNPFLQPDRQEVYVGPDASRLRVMSVSATASGRFAFLRAFGSNGVTERTITPDTETMVARMGPGIVAVRGRLGAATDEEVRMAVRRQVI